ncbi:ATP phosphoribosyltransferase regulatory subunit [Jannaschia sp. CCS1]|uniref:ATP phosphoribosyltransferase regulatory subunit n=1 Tax=Jannaschia sp. (strain CCS1) TaxID=290400 RepID=UPI000053D3EC|nr:ATP phosphoribosyltransferase regulatory subunit [Jannaschia sp. CCS1]ABD53863.1 ATP phosphoribosyltransferase regulatory subunit [Jannaschia sp. CCS1]
MTPKAAIRAEAEALQATFADAVPVDAPMLVSAETLLDLYGEDIRARAFTTHDPDRGELMLRPDFTVPVVEMHMIATEQGGAEPARYTYLGEVFRMQHAGADLPSEYLQVGYEVFDRSAPLQADAEVFALFSQALADVPTRAVTGDIGVLLAAIAALETTDARKAALRRHVWRPRRFRALLDRFTGAVPAPQGRDAYLSATRDQGLAAMIAQAGPPIGLRTTDEMTARLQRLEDDAAADPIDPAQADVLSDLLALKAPLGEAVDILANFTVDLPGLEGAVARVADRTKALANTGIAVDALPFEVSYGRTQMEYYDGFVFGILSATPGHPPLATGGRYDALTRQLGGGREIPAVGGVIRPELVLTAKEAAR